MNHQHHLSITIWPDGFTAPPARPVSQAIARGFGATTLAAERLTTSVIDCVTRRAPRARPREHRAAARRAAGPRSGNDPGDDSAGEPPAGLLPGSSPAGRAVVLPDYRGSTA
jgi:hypothetical protein